MILKEERERKPLNTNIDQSEKWPRYEHEN